MSTESLVLLPPTSKKDGEPYTTSDVIAKQTGNSYRSILRTIERQSQRLAKFGRVRFEITPFQTKGGTQEHKIYYLNEQQATLLITFLKNTDIVADFKVELVRQFYAMREELRNRQAQRAIGKPIRRNLTDAIRDSGENERMHGHAYSVYTDLAYLLTTGCKASKLRKANGGALPLDCLTADKLTEYQKKEAAISALLDVGLKYPQIKAALGNAKVTIHE